MPDELLIERVVGRRLDPDTGAIYHLKYKPPPADVAGRLIQRSDDTEDKVRQGPARDCRSRRAAMRGCSVLAFFGGVLGRWLCCVPA